MRVQRRSRNGCVVELRELLRVVPIAELVLEALG